MTRFQKITSYDIICPNPDCSDPTNVRRAGTEGEKESFRCQSCDKGFSADGNAMSKQFPAKLVGIALDLYFSGVSYQQLTEHLKRHHDVPQPSKRSVHDWVKAHSILAKRFMDGEVGADGREESATGKPVKARTGPHWVADELEIRVGGKPARIWNVLDADKKYIIAAHLSRGRTHETPSAFSRRPSPLPRVHRSGSRLTASKVTRTR